MKIYELTTFILFVSIMVRGVETSAHDKQWLSYEPAVVELEGKLIVELKYGPPELREEPEN